MRQIKFRAKALANGHWVYGNLIKRSDDCVSIRNSKSEPWVDPETVGQFTGLTDCNGKEIYEGDIVRIDGVETPLVVVWDEYCACFSAVDYNEFNSFAHSDISWWNFPQHRRVTIIGNIHDNPELLNQPTEV